MYSFGSVVLMLALIGAAGAARAAERPNLLIMMSDDQSFPHASAYGSKMVSTPNFDRVAKQGTLFTKAFCAAPGCSPSRAAFLTGRHIWQIEHAGTHASSFGKKYRTFMDLLSEAGYHTGYTGKGWGPGNWKAGGRALNPAGKQFGAKRGDYAAGFEAFLKARPDGASFAFWFGSSDPHRGFEAGSGRKSGKTLEQAEVPPFLPDTPEIREDLLDYAFEIERFDRDCGKMLQLLEATGEADNTIIIVTSDNGMAFPYAKANCTEFGIHMPLAVSWRKKFPGGRRYDELVSFVDLTATIHQATGIEAPKEFPLAGRGFLGVIEGAKVRAAPRPAVFAGRERHSSSRYNTLGYPQRCIRTAQYLLVHSPRPERWPAGAAQKYLGKPGSQPGSQLGPDHTAYHDIDACPTFSFMMANRHKAEIADSVRLAIAKRPEIQLFDVIADPGCTMDLAGDPEHAGTKRSLTARLAEYLRETGDPRSTGSGDIFETYPRYSSLRWFPVPNWAKRNPERVPDQPWIEQRRK